MRIRMLFDILSRGMQSPKDPNWEVVMCKENKAEMTTAGLENVHLFDGMKSLNDYSTQLFRIRHLELWFTQRRDENH